MYLANFRITFPAPFGILSHHGSCVVPTRKAKGQQIQVMDQKGTVSPYPATIHSVNLAGKAPEDYAFKFVGDL